MQLDRRLDVRVILEQLVDRVLDPAGAEQLRLFECERAERVALTSLMRCSSSSWAAATSRLARMWPRAAVRQAAALGGKSSDERRSMRVARRRCARATCSTRRRSGAGAGRLAGGLAHGVKRLGDVQRAGAA